MVQNRKHLWIAASLLVAPTGFSGRFELTYNSSIAEEFNKFNKYLDSITAAKTVFITYENEIKSNIQLQNNSKNFLYSLKSPDARNTFIKLCTKNLFFLNHNSDFNNFGEYDATNYFINGYIKEPLSKIDLSDIKNYLELDINDPTSFLDNINSKIQFDRVCFMFPMQISLKSGTKIINTNKGVKLIASHKEIDLTKALRSYFIEEMSLENSALVYSKIAQSSYSNSLSQKALHPEWNLYGRKTLSKKDYDLLQRSTVMAVWEVIHHPLNTDQSIEKPSPQNDTEKQETSSQPSSSTEEEKQKQDISPDRPFMESEIVGLLRDDQTNQLFYCKYDLGKDISILMNYTPKE